MPLPKYKLQQTQLPTAMIERSVPKACPIASLIVFPNSEILWDSEPPGHIKCVAFLRLKDETIWMLAIPGMDWTDQRLQVAANALSNVSANAYTKASIERLLRQELQVASVFLLQPAIRSVDLRQWGVREAAYVLAKRLAYTYSSHLFEESDTRLRFSSIEVALIDSLDEALQEFVDELEPQALKLASASGQLNQRLYNYLTHKSHRQFRVQLAETFPSLLVTSALAKRDTLGAELRSIVDSGTPLIKGLAGRWKVRPGVVRHLVGKPTGHVGIQWSRDAMGLAQALNALRPEDVPGDEADTWREFNHMVAVGQRRLCRGPGVAKRVCEPS